MRIFVFTGSAEVKNKFFQLFFQYWPTGAPIGATGLIDYRSNLAGLVEQLPLWIN
jgi:hypothetical protein